MSLDHLSGGRFIVGLGVSGPQVVEGWYGPPFAKPLARTREYVEIMRTGLRARGAGRPTTARIPAAARRADGPGQAAQAVDPPVPRRAARSTSPPRARRTWRSPPSSATAGCPVFSPAQDDYRGALGESSLRHRAAISDFEVAATVPLVLGRRSRGERPTRCARCYALYFGGMGAEGGPTSTPTSPSAHGLRGEVEDDPGRSTSRARKARRRPRSPSTSSTSSTLLGPARRLREDGSHAWHESVVTTLLIAGSPETLARPARARPLVHRLAAVDVQRLAAAQSAASEERRPRRCRCPRGGPGA